MDLLPKIFFNQMGRLRSGWRLVVFVVVFNLVLFLITGGARIIYAISINAVPELSPHANVADLVFRVIFLIASLGAGYLCVKLLEGLPWRSLGLTLHSHWLRDLIVGSVIGILSLAFATAIAFIGGGLHFARSPAAISAIILTLLVSALLFIIAALSEEALFRGYPLQTLTRAQLTWLGVLLTSVPFAAIHLKNPNAGSWIAFINTALAGVWLAVAYLRTRSLWFPLGVHWAWNWALGSVFGLPVSGITKIAPNPMLVGTDLGPAWFTGGTYGIEGGVACTIVLLISTVFIWKTSLVSATDDLKRLTSEEKPTTPRLETNIPVESGP